MSLAKWEMKRVRSASPRQLLHHMLSYRLYFTIIVSFHFIWICVQLLNRNRSLLMLARDCVQLKLCFFPSYHSLDSQP